MVLLKPQQLIVDQFSLPPTVDGGSRRLAVWQLVGLVPPVGMVVVVIVRHIRLINTAPLFTATSILTGIMFTLAVKFWEKSMDARKDPDFLFDTKRLLMIDQLRSQLVWTVVVGVCSTALFAVSAFLLQSPTGLPVAVTAVAAGLVTYQLSLVVLALVKFYDASYSLRS